VGKKRVFAGALEWPGWSRSGRDEDAAIAQLLQYRDRYAAAMLDFTVPASGTAIVIERVAGNATTDFGAPGVPPKADAAPLDGSPLKRHLAILEAAWGAFDGAAKRARGRSLSKGPRGGGRDLDKMIAHVHEAELAYLSAVGGSFKREAGEKAAAAGRRMRQVMVAAIAARARGEPPAKPRRSALWAPRYVVRRAAWHALDHAWEIEDRTTS
jgi:hypothetical protein